MKSSAYILVFLTGMLSVGAQPTGQAYYASRQTDTLMKRYTQRGPYFYSGPGVFGDLHYMQRQAEEFFENPDKNRWNYVDFEDEASAKSKSDLYVPIPINIKFRDKVASDNIHYAALYAHVLQGFAEEDSLDKAHIYADKIVQQLVARAMDDGLDFGNGQGANTPNKTFGTTIRWNANSTTVSPYFLAVGKMTKYLESYSLLTASTLGNRNEKEQQRLDGWFKDCRNWAFYKIAHIYQWAGKTSWQNLDFKHTGYNKPMPSSGSRTNPVFANAEGVPHQNYTTTMLQQTLFSNTVSKYVHYLHYYGLVYNDKEALQMADKYFKDWFRFSVFADGTHSELYRGFASKPDQGLQYWSISINEITAIAFTHAVAVKNGLPAVKGEEAGKYFDYVTTEGWHDYFSQYHGSSTSGGNGKGLKLWLEAFGKYIAQETGHGWQSTRHVNQSPYPLISMPSKMHYIGAVAMANSYYQDANLFDLYHGQGIYPPLKTKKEGADWIGAWEESSFGGFGSLLMSYAPYFGQEGLFESHP